MLLLLSKPHLHEILFAAVLKTPTCAFGGQRYRVNSYRWRSVKAFKNASNGLISAICRDGLLANTPSRSF